MIKEEVELFGIKFNNLTMEEALGNIQIIIDNNKVTNKSGYVVTPNVDHLVNIKKDSTFSDIYKHADLVLVDGMPIVKISKMVGKELKEKVSGSDLTPKIFELAQQKQYRVFIFGSREGVADKAIKKLQNENGYNFPILGFSPPFGFEKDSNILAECKTRIKNFKPDILLVSLGSPKGEYFIYNNVKELNVPISLQIGASIDFIAGTVKRAPIWMQKASLEWFYRFMQEPKRMFKRYFINDSVFFKMVLRELMKKN